MIAYIRVDASHLVGSGHIMRCLVLADLLNSAGHTVAFLCRDFPGNLNEYIIERGYECHVLPFSNKEKTQYSKVELSDDYDQWRGVSIGRDVEETKNILAEKKVDLLVVDHYGLDFIWHKQLREYTDKIMVIDDLANRHYDCDILLDHNFYIGLEKRYDGLVSESCKKLLGPSYALINPELKNRLENRKRLGKFNKDNKVQNILVFLGGVDTENYTGRVLDQALKVRRFEHCVFDVVLGRNNPNKAELKKRYCENDNVVFHVQPDYYYELMEKADLAIGAGGVSQLERSYLKIPSFVQVVAKNQQKIYEDMKLGGYVGSVEELDNKTLGFNELECGVLSIASLLSKTENSQLYCRLVDEKDIKDIYEWRTHPAVISASENKQVFSFSEHEKWFMRRMERKDSYFLMFESSDLKVGIVRFDLKKETVGLVNIFLNPICIGQGYGKRILKKGVFELFKNTAVIEVHADILEGNIASKHLFLSCGFNKYKESYRLNR